jgi:hypothetical protein
MLYGPSQPHLQQRRAKAMLRPARKNLMPAKNIRHALLAAFALAAATTAPARAQDALAQFYKGRQVTLVIPSSVGGGYDLYGRLLARFIGKYIPGNPNVVPSNMSRIFWRRRLTSSKRPSRRWY